MFSMCKLCKWFGICCMGGALTFHCPVDFDKDKNPCTPCQEHTHHETCVMQNFSQGFIANASSLGFSGEISPDFYNMTTSRDSTGDWPVVVVEFS